MTKSLKELLKEEEDRQLQTSTAAVNSLVQQGNKAEMGHLKASGQKVPADVREVRTESVEGFDLGQSFGAEVFTDIAYVDATGISKGKGFQGGVKRHNFQMQDATHGNSKAHRAVGSTGQCQEPGRVFKGKKMPGHMGSAKTTAVKLRVVTVNSEENYVLVKGAVPGAKGQLVFLSKSTRSPDT